MTTRGARAAGRGVRGDLFDPKCPTRQLLDRIGTKWTSMAVKTLTDAAPDEVRFAELRRRMPGVSQKMLSVTLRSLMRDGLVSRRVEPTVPPRVCWPRRSAPRSGMPRHRWPEGIHLDSRPRRTPPPLRMAGAVR
ncbi:helix-turn-helix domain-containing protein [Streptomyces sp. NPDC005507]|uniref:winged helix-turn-helix transcriptional regulator n=1 Tax=unclassified Streptomyces TaxID=2593676 RepID=UPI0033B9B823